MFMKIFGEADRFASRTNYVGVHERGNNGDESL